MTPAVSVIIPTYNRRELVVAAIESVLKQTFTDLELIVVDDGSTDGTRERLEPYMDRIRYFYQTNRGPSAAQNAGLKSARGKWVSILASDDAWHPTKLSRQLEALSCLGHEYGACFTDCEFVGNHTMTLTAFEEAGLETEAAFGPLAEPLLYLWESRYGLYVQSLLVLRALVTEVGGFDENLPVSEDRDLIFRLSFVTRFCYVSTPLVSIDRTNETPRLSSAGSEWDRNSLDWDERPLKKMLAWPALEDRAIRQIIERELRTLYYNRAAEGIRGFRLTLAIKSLKRIKQMGESFPKIWWRLVTRAAKRILRKTGA